MADPPSDGAIKLRGRGVPAPSTTVEHYAEIDPSLESSSICVAVAIGLIARQARME
jgi:hypothetical protein